MWIWCLLVSAGVASENPAVLVREYKSGNPSLVEVSADGRWVLTRAVRHSGCRGKKGSCNGEALEVYDSLTGKRIGEYASKDSGRLRGAGFDGAMIAATEFEWDARNQAGSLHGILWDPAKASVAEFALPGSQAAMPLCHVEADQFLGFQTVLNPPRTELKVSDSTGLHSLPGFVLPQSDLLPSIPVNCPESRMGSQFLMEGADEGLRWVPADPLVPARVCRSFGEERTHGFAASPDGSLIAVITGSGQQPILGPEYHVFLNVLSAGDCSLKRRFELMFPGAPANSLAFPAQFARQLAISPDNRRFAFMYGVSRGGAGYAFAGLYSLTDGHHIATLTADANHCGILHGALSNDQYSCANAPIEGAIQFGPDSQMLFATSRHVYQWKLAE